MLSFVLIGVYDIGVFIFDYYYNVVVVLLILIFMYCDEFCNVNFDEVIRKFKDMLLLILKKMGFNDENWWMYN